MEEVSSKITLKWYKLAKNAAGSSCCEVIVQTGLAQLGCWRITRYVK